MFLQFGQSPRVADDCVDLNAKNEPCLTENQYSVFSPSIDAANGQVKLAVLIKLLLYKLMLLFFLFL